MASVRIWCFNSLAICVSFLAGCSAASAKVAGHYVCSNSSNFATIDLAADGSYKSVNTFVITTADEGHWRIDGKKLLITSKETGRMNGFVMDIRDNGDLSDGPGTCKRQPSQ